MAYTKTLSIALAAASVNNIAQSQTPSGAGTAFTLNGSAVSGGVATLDTARRVFFTLAADETGHSVTITGTGYNGAAQSEVLALTTTSATSVRDYKTVTRVTISATATGAIQIGTSGAASTEPWIVDPYTVAGNIGANMDFTGTVNADLEVSTNYYGPAWDLSDKSPVWTDATNFTGKTSDTTSVIVEPVTMIRLTQNTFSTGGTVSASLIQPMASVS